MIPPDPPKQPSNEGSNAFAWIGLLIGGAILLMIVWENSGAHFFRKDESETNSDVISLTAANWQKEVVESKVPVVVDFWAPWCSPCVKFAPTIDKLATFYSGRVKFCKVNIDKAKDLAAKYEVRTIPRVMIFKGGELATDPLEPPGLETKLTQVLDGFLKRS